MIDYSRAYAARMLAVLSRIYLMRARWTKVTDRRKALAQMEQANRIALRALALVQ